MLFEGLKENDTKKTWEAFLAPCSLLHTFTEYLSEESTVSFGQGTAFFIAQPGRSCLGQEKLDWKEQVLWARCGHCLISSVQVALNQPRKRHAGTIWEKSNNKQLALRVKPEEQCPGESVKSISSFILVQISDL